MSTTTCIPLASLSPVLQFFRRMHLYIGFFAGPFIFFAALTGTLYILTPQIENLMYKDVLTAKPEGEMAPLSMQISVARAFKGDNAKIYAVRPAHNAVSTTRVMFSNDHEGPSTSHAVFVDPYTLRVKGQLPVYGTSGILPFRIWLDQLHSGMLLGSFGRIYSELAASWLWVAALGGVALWVATKKARPSKSSARGPRSLTRGAHTSLGLLLLSGMLFVSVTGLTWSQWAGDNISRLRSEMNWMTPQVNTHVIKDTASHSVDHSHGHEGHEMMPAGLQLAPHCHIEVNKPDADWGKALLAARLAGIDAENLELRQPVEEGRTWVITELGRRWPTQADVVALNPQDFSVIDRVNFDNFPLMAKLTRWGVDAHMGILFGLPNQLILIFFGSGLCIMTVLGYRMWWLRKPVAAINSPVTSLYHCWLDLSLYWKTGFLITSCLLGYMMPVMGGSLLIFAAFDVVCWRLKSMKARKRFKD
ncbi:PepSY-associated TM helix domain-containing protein [Pantoea sp. SORGH_AS_0659]|uniref:PepSY-associated TM helix domain-containing protein n=1 Tax=Pantoea sp. SORGH_AS_0659 TaxID=3062597 RepID=UPI0028584869|nr:PepSY-associated TM helix domain-containing protein [Pantoea sp. SORGH_AS_0659]MDR6352585.1 putative iron-regulated membrane protein [Pantoea sp. SORGH_AS_0659]